MLSLGFQLSQKKKKNPQCWTGSLALTLEVCRALCDITSTWFPELCDTVYTSREVLARKNRRRTERHGPCGVLRQAGGKCRPQQSEFWGTSLPTADAFSTGGPDRIHRKLFGTLSKLLQCPHSGAPGQTPESKLHTDCFFVVSDTLWDACITECCITGPKNSKKYIKMFFTERQEVFFPHCLLHKTLCKSKWQFEAAWLSS